MKKRRWIPAVSLAMALALCVMTAGCGKSESPADGNGDTSAEEALPVEEGGDPQQAVSESDLMNQLADAVTATDANSLYMATEKTLEENTVVSFSPELAESLASALRSAELSEEKIDMVDGSQRFAQISVFGEPYFDLEMYYCDASHEEHPDTSILWLTRDDEETRYYTMDNASFTQIHGLLEASTYVPEIPVEAFVEPIKQVLAVYRENRITEDQRQFYEPLPEGAALPEVETAADFTAFEASGQYAYGVNIPMSGGIDMRCGMIYFDDTGWGVAKVEFTDSAS